MDSVKEIIRSCFDLTVYDRLYSAARNAAFLLGVTTHCRQRDCSIRGAFYRINFIVNMQFEALHIPMPTDQGEERSKVSQMVSTLNEGSFGFPVDAFAWSLTSNFRDSFYIAWREESFLTETTKFHSDILPAELKIV